MYIPASFAETNRQRLYDLIRDHNFATLVSNGTSCPDVTQLPFLLDTEAGANGTLIGHMARANPHWRNLTPETDVLVMFQGAHSYISPTWYDTPSVVPTWNYAAVHAYGKLRLIHDAGQLKSIVTALVVNHERQMLTGDFPEALLQAIVGIEIPIERLEGKFKMSQNKSSADQRGVITALAQSEQQSERDVARIMQENFTG